MKKTLIALTIALTSLTANATPTMTPVQVHSVSYYNGYHNGYNNGYRHGHSSGKTSAYHNVGRTLVIVGAVVIAGVVAYDLGRNSRWGAGENGITYRF